MVKPNLHLIFKIFFISILFSVFITLISFSPGNPPPPAQDQSPDTGLATYQNDILGLEFKYPKDQNITTNPNHITHLAQLDSDRNDSQWTHNQIDIVFSPPSSPNLNMTIYNDNHQGKIPYYSGYDQNSTAFIDNFNSLKSTGDICGYHEKFVDNRAAHHEVYFSCDSQTNTSQSLVQIKTIDQNGKNYYQYKLSHSYYKKLKNGSYDHLLVSQSDYIVHSENNPIINSLPDIYSYLSQSDLDTQYTQFKTFTSTIKSFSGKPYSPQKTDRFLPSDSNVNTIYQYYSYLEQGQLSSAYDMYLTTTTPFSDYQSWYEKVIFTDILQIVKQPDGSYRIDVVVQDRNQEPRTYRVLMKITENKIQTLSSVELIEETLYNGSLSIRIESSNQNRRLILTQDNQDTVLAICPRYLPTDGEKFASNCYFSKPEFISNGKYLIVDYGAWEYGSKKVYDLQTNQELFEAPYPDYFTYLENRNQFIACHGELFGMASLQYASIFDLNNQVEEISVFELIKQDRPSTEMIDFKCDYDQAKNDFIINADFYYGGSTKEYSQQYLYNLDTQKLTVIRQ